jgi:hypothetical protein
MPNICQLLKMMSFLVGTVWFPFINILEKMKLQGQKQISGLSRGGDRLDDKEAQRNALG